MPLCSRLHAPLTTRAELSRHFGRFGTILAFPSVVRALFPTRALAALLAIGLLDLVATAILHAQGQIEELNPVMAPVIAGGEWRFVAVKSATLAFAWLILARRAKDAPTQVRRACLWGCAAYLCLLGGAFLSG